MSAPTPGVDPLAAEHARLLQDRSIQFSFDVFTPPPPTPEWLKALGRWLTSLGPALKWLVWLALGAAVLAIVFLIVRELVLYRRPGGRKRRGRGLEVGPDAWRPSAARVKALLEDADRLAAEGRYAEAAHVLLHRSVDDIEGRRPDLVRPSLTSRDIAALPPLAAPVRDAFGRIARVVERGLFAGRDVNASDWAECRAAYAALGGAEAWAGGARA